MKKVLIPLAQGCEELEAVTVIDLLRRANIHVVTASLDDKPIQASRNVTLIADTTLNQAMHEQYEMIVLPGGLPGATHLQKDERITTLIKTIEKAGGFVAAICAAPKILADLGLLNGKRATAYPGILDNTCFPDIQLTNQAVEHDGLMITSRGPGTAIDFALTLIDILAGKVARDTVDKGLVRNQ